MKLLLLATDRKNNLWPFSNGMNSDPFIQLLKDIDGIPESSIQRICHQLQEVNIFNDIYIVANNNKKDLISSQLGEDVNVIKVPEPLNTFSAILLSSSYLYSSMSCPKDTMMCVMYADAIVDSNYYLALKNLSDSLQKTDRNIGRILTKNQDTSINNGSILFRLGYMMDMLKKREFATNYEALLSKPHLLETLEKECIEQEKNMVTASYTGTYKNLNDWRNVTEEIDKKINGVGKIEASDNTHIINKLNIPVIVNGIGNAIIVASSDGVLVSRKELSSNIEAIIHDLDHRAMYEEKRWGWYQVIDYKKSHSDQVLTKRIHVNAGENLSYQFHHHRKEIWTITEGKGLFAFNGTMTPIQSGDVLKIPQGGRHAIKAITDLEMIEVQMGSKLIEEDIVRLFMSWEDIESHCTIEEK